MSVSIWLESHFELYQVVIRVNNSLPHSNILHLTHILSGDCNMIDLNSRSKGLDGLQVFYFCGGPANCISEQRLYKSL